jgi:hypothetical protein
MGHAIVLFIPIHWNKNAAAEPSLRTEKDKRRSGLLSLLFPWGSRPPRVPIRVFVLLPSVTKDSIIRRYWQKTQSKCDVPLPKLGKTECLPCVSRAMPWKLLVALFVEFPREKRMESATVLTSDAWKTKLLTSRSYNARFYSLMSLLVY